MGLSGALYTPEVLALAAGLSEFPLSAEFARLGEARSRTCGSILRLGLDIGPAGQIYRLGMAASTCAIGQAAAAIFARHAVGLNSADIAGGLAGIESWLGGAEALPDWPGFSAIARARDYPARHGAISLPWIAALDALPYRDQAS